MAVVNNLKEIRESQGLLQEDLASATDSAQKLSAEWNVVNGHHPLNLCSVLQHILICLLKMSLSWKSTDFGRCSSFLSTLIYTFLFTLYIIYSIHHQFDKQELHIL